MKQIFHQKMKNIQIEHEKNVHCLSHKESQIKTTVDIAAQVIQMLNNRNYWQHKRYQGSEEASALIYCWWKCKILNISLWKSSFAGFFFLLKMICNYCMTQHLLLLGICPREMEKYVHIQISTWVFVVALFLITKGWKQLKCLCNR